MQGILADINVLGHQRLLLAYMESEAWRELWQSLRLSIQTFEGLALSREATDVEVWQKCQEQELVFITANRRQKELDSLEAAIRRFNTDQSLPVLTFADAQRFLEGKAYAARTAKRFLEYLFDIDQYRGVGRLYIP